VTVRILEKDGDENHDEAIIILARLRNKLGLDELLKEIPRIMRKVEDWQKDQIVQILGDSGDERAVGPLLALEGYPRIRSAAFRALDRMGYRHDADSLIHELSNHEKDERSAAARTLGSLGDVRAVDPLIWRSVTSTATSRPTLQEHWLRWATCGLSNRWCACPKESENRRV